MGYKIKTPEGGYGYVICISTCIILITAYSPMPVLSILFQKFYVEANADFNDISQMGSVFYTTMAFSGLVTNGLLKKFKPRTLGIISAFIYSISWILTPAMSSMWHVIFLYGVLQGVTVWTLTTIVFDCLNSYFDEKRLLMTALCQLVVGLANTAFPLLVDFLIQSFGHKGALLIVGSICLHSVFAAIALHPVKWHAERIQITYNLEPVLVRLMNKNETAKSSKEDIPEKSCRSALIKLLKALDLDLFKDIVYVNIALGISIAIFNDTISNLFLPIYFAYLGMETTVIAALTSILNAGDLLGRIFLAIVSKFYKPSARNMAFLAILTASVSRLLYLSTSEYWAFAVLSLISGCSRPFYSTTLPIIIVEHIPERFSSAFGLFVLFSGLLSGIMMSIYGYVAATMEGFDVMFYFTFIYSLFAVVPWAIEITYRKYNTKNIKK